MDNDMTFAEIQENRDKFLHRYGLDKLFPQCSVSWDTLMEIGDDYETKCFGDGREVQKYKGVYYELIQRYIAQVALFQHVHSYRFRIKRTASLLGKVIRKNVEHNTTFTKDNYFQKITDLLGLRILYVFKEDYWPVDEQIMAAYESQLAQHILVKLKVGDDETMYNQLRKKYNNVKLERNETYRSIHYTFYAETENIKNCPLIEFQTRTIFEEGWSEINHKLVYKKHTGNPGLKKTSDVLSSMVGACDAMGTLMKLLHDTGVQFDTTELRNEGLTSEQTDNVVEVIRKFLQS